LDIAKSTVQDENLEACIWLRVKRWQFPRPSGEGSVIVTYPFVFRASSNGGEQGP
jgi:hypothetical protein